MFKKIGQVILVVGAAVGFVAFAATAQAAPNVSGGLNKAPLTSDVQTVAFKGSHTGARHFRGHGRGFHGGIAHSKGAHSKGLHSKGVYGRSVHKKQFHGKRFQSNRFFHRKGVHGRSHYGRGARHF